MTVFSSGKNRFRGPVRAQAKPITGLRSKAGTRATHHGIAITVQRPRTMKSEDEGLPLAGRSDRTPLIGRVRRFAFCGLMGALP